MRVAPSGGRELKVARLRLHDPRLLFSHNGDGMKKLFIAAIFLISFFPLAVLAQFTTVSATVTDINGSAYAGCNGSISFVASPTATQQATLSGSTFQTSVVLNQCDSTGSFTVILADNNQVTDGHAPGQQVSQWRFNICASDRKTCFTSTITITGSTQNISATLQSVAKILAQSFNVIYAGNTAADNGSDAITGILASGTSTQSARDQIGISLTSIWAPNATSPVSPFHFGFDGLTFCSLAATNSVASTTITSCGTYSGNVGMTAAAGKTVTVTDLISGGVANAPTFGGTGTTTTTHTSGWWTKNQGSANVSGDSYGNRYDAQSGCGGTCWNIWEAGTGPNHLGDRLETMGAERNISYHNSAYPIVNTDETILCDTTSGGFTVTLPTAASALHSSSGGVFTIKQVAAANTCTVSSNGSFIDGAATYTGLSSQFKYVVVQSNGTQYYIIGNN